MKYLPLAVISSSPKVFFENFDSCSMGGFSRAKARKPPQQFIISLCFQRHKKITFPGQKNLIAEDQAMNNYEL